jgi:hypothetical protein
MKTSKPVSENLVPTSKEKNPNQSRPKMGAMKTEMDEYFWKKHEKIMNRDVKIIDEKNFRVSDFKKKEE